MNPHDETEADTRANRIDPVLQAAGWGKTTGSRIRRELICPGRIMPGGKRSNPLSVDYVLIYRDQKLAVIEAKRAGLGSTTGLAQAKNYATRLQTRFAYATNGLGWYEVDMHSGHEGPITTPFPSPDTLWQRAFTDANDWRERFGNHPFETAGGKWELRYYQHNAITAALHAIGTGQRRILLTLATGTGKTPIAFQIAWKLFQARWTLAGDGQRRPRILFLADRNILADQAYNAFDAFPADAIARIDPDTIRRKGGVPKNASLFFTIFQTFMSGDGTPHFHGYPQDFFDFIIIDECHRGGAKDESEWRAILDHFAPAIQIGLTATPKRQHNADTYAYFGEPVYSYSLRQGIEDGFLTPFKVRQMASTLDEYVYDSADTVLSGTVDPDRTYTEADFNTRIGIEEREHSRVAEFMYQVDSRQKTLVFCATQAHAARVRDYINQLKKHPSPNYCQRVTAEDGKLGEQHLRDFQDNDKRLPTVLTTSQKLSTGVDARNVRHIVLMRPIRSMIEFKQIIGRGTRTYDGKDFFTIWDFVKAHENFNDPEWDGEPVEPVQITPRAPRDPDATPSDDNADPDSATSERPEPLIIQLADGKARTIRYIATTTYWGPEGKPLSARQFLERLFGDLSALITDEDQLRQQWSDPEQRERFIDLLEQRGYDADKLDDMRRLIDAPHSDLFDVLNYVLFTTDPKTRQQRADDLRQHRMDKFHGEMRELLLNILQAYEQGGEAELASRKLGPFLTARYGSIGESKAQLGELPQIKAAFRDLQTALYVN